MDFGTCNPTVWVLGPSRLYQSRTFLSARVDAPAVAAGAGEARAYKIRALKNLAL